MEGRFSDAQEKLIECLKFLKLSPNAAIAVMLLVKTDGQIAEMADFLLQNPDARESDILKAATDINERTTNDV